MPTAKANFNYVVCKLNTKLDLRKYVKLINLGARMTLKKKKMLTQKEVNEAIKSVSKLRQSLFYKFGRYLGKKIRF